MQRRAVVTLGICLVLTLLGCNRAPSPDFAPVQGTVTINGKPQKGLLIRFSPDPEKGNGMPALASGTSDDQGKYSLRYEFRNKEGEGAPVGWHRVTLIDTSVGFTPQGSKPKPSAVPAVYNSPTTTPLVVEVRPGENHALNLEVKK
jgi:hypothetical protein